jgi:hypothetical protein
MTVLWPSGVPIGPEYQMGDWLDTLMVARHGVT